QPEFASLMLMVRLRRQLPLLFLRLRLRCPMLRRLPACLLGRLYQIEPIMCWITMANQSPLVSLESYTLVVRCLPAAIYIGQLSRRSISCPIHSEASQARDSIVPAISCVLTTTVIWKCWGAPICR